MFAPSRWLDKKNGLSVTLTPDRDGDGIGDALEGGPEVEYTATIYTSDIRGAGTDANVFIELHGDKAATGERRLDDDAVGMALQCKQTYLHVPACVKGAGYFGARSAVGIRGGGYTLSSGCVDMLFRL